MGNLSPKKIFASGLALAIPLGIVFYLFLKFVGLFEKLIEPIAHKLGIQNILGELTISILAILLLLIIIFLLGLLMRFDLVKSIQGGIRDMILRFIPSLNQLQLMASQKLDIELAVQNWKPVLLQKGDEFIPAYLIEEGKDLLTFALVKGPDTSPDSLFITHKGSVSFQSISFEQLKKYNRQFGKGYQSIITSK